MKHILTLCIGNICRSPISEALLAREFPDKTIWSAGLCALVGNPADPLSIEVAAAHGLDLSAHRAQQLVGWMCQSAELILVMEQGHKTEVERLYPLARGKVYRLGELGYPLVRGKVSPPGELGKFDIADTYRQPKAAFENAYTLIARGVADWAPCIRQLG